MISENEFLLHSLLMGIFITFVYDLLRIFRRVVPHADFIVSVEDFGFWVFCSTEVFLLMHRESNGTLRWFAVIGAMLGMYLYKKLVSPLFVKYLTLLLKKILWIVGKILRILCRPLGMAGRKAGRGVCRIEGRISRRMKKWKRSVKMRLTFFVKAFKIHLKA